MSHPCQASIYGVKLKLLKSVLLEKEPCTTPGYLTRNMASWAGVAGPRPSPQEVECAYCATLLDKDDAWGWHTRPCDDCWENELGVSNHAVSAAEGPDPLLDTMDKERRLGLHTAAAALGLTTVLDVSKCWQPRV